MPIMTCRLSWMRRGLLALAFVLPAAAAAACGEAPDRGSAEPRDPLLRPAQFTETAPPRFAVRFETTAGEFVVEVRREWAPIGADRFYNLVQAGYYDDTRIYRVVPGFMAQFGIHGDPFIHRAWARALLRDDPVVESNSRGRVTFAKAGPNSRTAEVFISTVENARLDADGFAPFGEVVEGMEVVDAFHAGYGDGPPRGEGPYAAMAHARGNEYLDEEYPELTRIIRAVVVDAEG
ncbi:MAG: peptidylprolyl isomerase [Gemmatimonadales bacterium]|nr:MAG: peptidylprolyl isomerase [Gemmatimonadales bacterium]